MPRGQALPRLTSLRIAAALVVVLFHLHDWQVASLAGALSDLGFVGVAFFFVLSGVVLAWGTAPTLPVRTFYRRRFARIWPSHVAVALLAAVVPVVAVSRGWPEALPNLLLVQAWSPDPEIAFAMNGVSWSLACEAFFYATFPVAVRVLRMLPEPWRWATAGGALVVGVGAGLLLPGVAFYWPGVRYGEFLLGLVAGLALRDGWRPRIPLPVVLGALAVGGAVSSVVPYPLANGVMAVPFLLVILVAARRDLDGAPGWLRSRWLVFAGEASFALYLVHELVIINLGPVLTPTTPWLKGILLIGVSAVAAVLLHLAVERPLNRRLRGGRPTAAMPPPVDRVPAEAAPAAPAPRRDAFVLDAAATP